MAKINTVNLDLSFELINKLSSIDRFSGEWSNIERREGIHTLKQLKSIATVQSVGASTRIEGSKLTNDEIQVLLFENLKIDKLEQRDKQEVVGYFQALDTISESFADIRVSEGDVKNIHKILMKHSEKDEWHRGEYKQHPNSVDAHYPDGSTVTIFNTTKPGQDTEVSMRALFEWYQNDKSTPAIIKVAVFVYEFLSIHPFQDGNGRLSRLLGTLLLLKQGYPWIQFVSFEHEIENRKTDYYKVLMDCQQNRPGENVDSWLDFFLACLSSIQDKLMQKLETQQSQNALNPREKKIVQFIEAYPGVKSGEIASKLNIPLPSVKRILSEMIADKIISKNGTGTGTNYTAERNVKVKSDLLMKFSSQETEKLFTLPNKHAFIEIKKIILTPKFEWKIPDEWAKYLSLQNPTITLEARTMSGGIYSQDYAVQAFNSPFYFQPVFEIHNGLQIPTSLLNEILKENEYPVGVKIKLSWEGEDFSFDVQLVYDISER
jgi:Fic family protein